VSDNRVMPCNGQIKKETLLHKFEEDEENVRRVYQVRPMQWRVSECWIPTGFSYHDRQAREREHMLQRERKHLKQIMKLENVERVKRIQEYKRLEVGCGWKSSRTGKLEST
jgi:hypothetical protein